MVLSVSKDCTALIFRNCPEDGSITILRNGGIYLVKVTHNILEEPTHRLPYSLSLSSIIKYGTKITLNVNF
jgi:hypothetical protein